MEKIKSYFGIQLSKDLYFEDIYDGNLSIILDAFDHNKIVETENSNIIFYYGLYYMLKKKQKK